MISETVVKKIVYIDSWTKGIHNFNRIDPLLCKNKIETLLIHTGSWGAELGRPKEEDIDGIKCRDISYYGTNLGDRAKRYVDGKGLGRITDHINEVLHETYFKLDDLFIFSHPGLEALVASGVISKLVNSGKKVGIVVIGDGINSRLKSSSAVKERSKMHINLEKSFYESCSALGVEVKYIFRYPDNEFDTQPLLGYVNIIESILSRHKPAQVWTHLNSGINIDHKIVNKAVMIATRPVANFSPSTVFGFKIPGSNDWSFSDSFNVNDNWFEEVDLKSERRLGSYLSYDKVNYFHHKLHDIELINLQLRINGAKIGVEAAETFYLIRRSN